MKDSCSKSKYSWLTLMDSLEGMFFRCLPDHKMTMIYCSAGAFGLTGFNPFELTGDQGLGFDFIYEDDREMVFTERRQIMVNHNPLNLEYRIRNKNGEISYVREMITLVRGENANSIHLEGHIKDVFRENQLLVINNAFSSFQKAVNANFLVSVSDMEGKILFVNSVLCKKTGYSEVELLGQKNSLWNNPLHSNSYFSDTLVR